MEISLRSPVRFAQVDTVSTVVEAWNLDGRSPNPELLLCILAWLTLAQACIFSI